MAIVIEGLTDGALRRLIGKKLDALAGHLHRPPTAVHVGFRDENGPRGGVDTRCALTIEMPGQRALHATDIAATARQTFDLAFEALERRALKEIDRARDGRRRAKKYYVAKRLLETGEAPGRARRAG